MTNSTYKRWDVWMEGFPHDEEGLPGLGEAELLGSDKAFSFREACGYVLGRNGYDLDCFNPDDQTYNGQHLFDNESDARKSFG